MSPVPQHEIGDRVFAVVVAPLAVAVATAGRVAGDFAARVLGAGEGTNSIVAYGGTTVAVLGFAGLLVRQLVQSNGAWKEIVTSLRDELDRERTAHEYTRWERESERFLAGKRNDPGPAPTSHHPRSSTTS